MSIEEKLNNSHLIILKILEGSWHVDPWLPVLIPIVQFDSGQIWVEISNKREAQVVEDPHATQYIKQSESFSRLMFIYTY